MTELRSFGEIKFFVPGLPKTAGSKRVFMVKGRPIITDDNAKSKDWKSDIKHFAIDMMKEIPPFDCALEVTFEFLLPRPKSHFGKLGIRKSAPGYPRGRPDVLKLSRAVEDALSGICWKDDAQIVSEKLRKRYAFNESPGCWITVSTAPGEEEYALSKGSS
jgi:crossover junction endodeoxyribonuclease RusA